MDNIIFRFLLQCWPILLAVIVTVLLLYSWMRPEVTAEKLQRGLVQQKVLNAIGRHNYENNATQDWITTYKKMEDRLPKTPSKTVHKERIHYQTLTTASLVWILFWAGACAFISIRIMFNPVYYGGEAIFLGYFSYYIIIGLISYFRR